MDSDTPKSVEFSGYVAWRKPKCHDPGFYQFLGEIFVFILLVLIENSQGFKTF
jgi:hypothetical protein